MYTNTHTYTQDQDLGSTMMSTAHAAAAETLQIERDGDIVTLRFNRPAAFNAIDEPMANAFLAAIKSVAADPTVRAVILCGAGKAFIAGGDLATLRADPVKGAKDLLVPLNEAILCMADMNAPIIAQVHGASAGGGLSLMMHADFVVAAQGTKFNLAYINLGVNCDVGGSYMLPRLVGLRNALEIALLGDTFSADEALRYGLINRVVPPEELHAVVQTLAQRLAQGPTLAYGRMRRLMRASFDHALQDQLAAEAREFIASGSTLDFKAGLEAFFTKTPAKFQGR